VKEIKRYNVEIDYDYNGDCPHLNDYVYKTGAWCKSDDVLGLELELIEAKVKYTDHKAVVEELEQKILFGEASYQILEGKVETMQNRIEELEKDLSIASSAVEDLIDLVDEQKLKIAELEKQRGI